MRNDLTNLAWPAFRLGELLIALARRSRIAINLSATLEAPRGVAPEQMDQWLGSAAHVLGLEAEPVDTTYPEVPRFLTAAGPAILMLPGDGYIGLLSGGRSVSVIAPDLKVYRLAIEVLGAALCADHHQLGSPRWRAATDRAAPHAARLWRSRAHAHSHRSQYGL